MTSLLHIVIVPTTEHHTLLDGTEVTKTMRYVEVNGIREPKRYGSYQAALDRVLTIQSMSDADIQQWLQDHAAPQTEAEAADWLERHDLVKLRRAERAVTGRGR